MRGLLDVRKSGLVQFRRQKFGGRLMGGPHVAGLGPQGIINVLLGTALAGIATAISPRLGRLTHWGAILHVLQALDVYDRPLPEGPALARFAQSHITHERPFARAWAVNALCVLAIHHPEFRAAAETARNDALNDTAASVRARARKAPVVAMAGGAS